MHNTLRSPHRSATRATDSPRVSGTALAHEIRHPVATLIASSQILQSRLGQTHECAGFARLIAQTSERLCGLVTDLAILDKSPSGELRCVDLRESLMELLVTLNAQAERAGARLAAVISPEPLYALADPAALALSLQRIGAYVLESTPAGETMRVRAFDDPEGHVRIVLGSPAAMNTVAEFALPGVDQSLNLRLAICRAILERTGGRLTLRYDTDSGVAVDVELKAVPHARG